MTMHKNIQLVGTVTVGPKGQVVILSEVRDRMGIVSGDKLVALYFPEEIGCVHYRTASTKFCNKNGRALYTV